MNKQLDIPTCIRDYEGGIIDFVTYLNEGRETLNKPIYFEAENADGTAAQTYANIIAVRAGDENSPKTQALLKALKTDAVKQYIADTYNGAVVASF